MRISLLSTLCLLLIPAMPVRAEPPAESTFVKPYKSEGDVRMRTPLTSQLVYERAVFRARQRAARLETRKWLGVSTARPLVQDHFERVTYPRPAYPWYGTHSPSRVRIQVP